MEKLSDKEYDELLSFTKILTTFILGFCRV